MTIGSARERRWELGVAVTSSRLNTAELICKHWGEEALMGMHDVRIDVRGQDEDAHTDTEASLKSLVEKLKARGSVRKLVVNGNNR